MRTENDLREAMHELAGTSRAPEVVLTRVTAGRRRRSLNGRPANFLVAAAAVVVVAAVATPIVLNQGGGGASGSSAAEAGGGAAAARWTFAHSITPSPDWQVRIRRMDARAETTIVTSAPRSTALGMSCTFTVDRVGAPPSSTGPTVDINGRPGWVSTSDNGVAVHWTLADNSPASLTCPVRDAAVELARAVNDEPQTVTLPYRLTSYPHDYEPTSLTVEDGGDQTTTTVVLNSRDEPADLTIEASSLRTDGDQDGAEPTTVNDHPATLSPARREISFAGNDQTITARLGATEPKTSAARARTLLLDAAQAIDVSSGRYEADTALQP